MSDRLLSTPLPVEEGPVIELLNVDSSSARSCLTLEGSLSVMAVLSKSVGHHTSFKELRRESTGEPWIVCTSRPRPMLSGDSGSLVRFTNNTSILLSSDLVLVFS